MTARNLKIHKKEGYNISLPKILVWWQKREVLLVIYKFLITKNYLNSI